MPRRVGTRSNPRIINTEISSEGYMSEITAIREMYDEILPLYKRVKVGDYVQINVSMEGEHIKDVFVKRGSLKVKPESVRTIARMINATIREEQGFQGTPELSEEDLSPDDISDIDITDYFEMPTDQAIEKYVKPFPIKKDKKGRYHDAKGRYIKGQPRRDKRGRWRDANGRYIAVKKSK